MALSQPWEETLNSLAPLPSLSPPETMGMGILAPEGTGLLDTEQARKQQRGDRQRPLEVWFGPSDVNTEDKYMFSWSTKTSEVTQQGAQGVTSKVYLPPQWRVRDRVAGLGARGGSALYPWASGTLA